MPTEKTPASKTKVVATTIVILAAMLFGWYVLKRVADIPGQVVDVVRNDLPEAIDKTSGALDTAADRAALALKRLHGAIANNVIKSEYASTATTLAGTRSLQVARINQIELFQRTDRASRLGIRMPDLIVTARAPIEYVYYLDLTGDWDFEFDGKRVLAIAPPLEFNKPSVDASAITYKVEEGSFLRDHQSAIDALKATITSESLKRAQQNVQIAREAARKATEHFVTSFIVRAYEVSDDTPVKVIFRDELPEKALRSKL